MSEVFACDATRSGPGTVTPACVLDEHDGPVHVDAAGVEWRAEQAIQRRAKLPVAVHTVKGRPVWVECVSDSTVRFGPFLFDRLSALDASIALAQAVQALARADRGDR